MHKLQQATAALVQACAAGMFGHVPVWGPQSTTPNHQAAQVQALLEVLDTLLYRTLPKNPELVYSLLHKQSVVEGLSDTAIWNPPARSLANVREVVRHFSAAVDEAAGGAGDPKSARASGADWSVERVRGIIAAQLLTWRPAALSAAPELRFTYEEAAGAQEFFMPYLWTLAAEHPCVALPVAAAP